MANLVQKKSDDNTSNVSSWVTLRSQELVKVFIIGALVGLVAYLLFVVLERYIFDVLMCQQNKFGRCGDSSSFAGGTAMILSAFVGLVLLVRERIFRPLLVVLASLIALWGSFAFLSSTWWIALLSAVLAFGIAYTAFTWLAQVTKFWLGLILVVIVVVLTRIALL